MSQFAISSSFARGVKDHGSVGTAGGSAITWTILIVGRKAPVGPVRPPDLSWLEVGLAGAISDGQADRGMSAFGLLTRRRAPGAAVRTVQRHAAVLAKTRDAAVDMVAKRMNRGLVQTEIAEKRHVHLANRPMAIRHGDCGDPIVVTPVYRRGESLAREGGRGSRWPCRKSSMRLRAAVIPCPRPMAFSV